MYSESILNKYQVYQKANKYISAPLSERKETHFNFYLRIPIWNNFDFIIFEKLGIAFL